MVRKDNEFPSNRSMVRYSFAKSNVVIVGASSGIGAAVSEGLSAAGANLFLIARNSKKLKSIAANLNHAKIISADISKRSECRRLAKEIGRFANSIDYLVISSGIFETDLIQKVNEEEWDRVIDTNLKGPFFLVQSLLPLIKKGEGKSIVVLSSILAHMGAPGWSVYCASKGGLSALTRALAVELAPFKIRINAVSPGHIKTPMISNILHPREIYREVKKQYPLRRIGKPHDIVHLVMFLLSTDASWITGSDYLIDGGRSAVG